MRLAFAFVFIIITAEGQCEELELEPFNLQKQIDWETRLLNPGQKKYAIILAKNDLKHPILDSAKVNAGDIGTFDETFIVHSIESQYEFTLNDGKIIVRRVSSKNLKIGKTLILPNAWKVYSKTKFGNGYRFEIAPFVDANPSIAANHIRQYYRVRNWKDTDGKLIAVGTFFTRKDNEVVIKQWQTNKKISVRSVRLSKEDYEYVQLKMKERAVAWEAWKKKKKKDKRPDILKPEDFLK